MAVGDLPVFAGHQLLRLRERGTLGLHSKIKFGIFIIMNVTLESLPLSLPRENAVELVLEQGVIIFRASSFVQNHIEEMVDRQKSGFLTPQEESELDAFEEIDDYLSHVNRLIRNSSENGEVGLAS